MTSPRKVTICKMPSFCEHKAYSNCVLVPGPTALSTKAYITLGTVCTRYHTSEPLETLAAGTVCCNAIQRSEAAYILGDRVELAHFVPEYAVGEISFEVSNYRQTVFRQETRRVVDSDEVTAAARSQFERHLFAEGQRYLCKIGNQVLELWCTHISGVHLFTGKREISVPALLTSVSEIRLTEGPAVQLLSRGDQSEGPKNTLFRADFSFVGLGIGGLDKELENIFRQAFVSRVMPPQVMSDLGVPHAKGMLLYGPPGTGKTLIARRIGEMLNGHPPQIVNGPQILSKYVGEAEERIRKLFEPAEREQALRGDASQLHIIIFDEIDAVCKSRGSVQDGTGVHDTIVNQLLSKLDGVDQLNNILVIGMTNRPDVIDEALTRQGRLEIKVEIGLPDAVGRRQILMIHTEKQRASGALTLAGASGTLAGASGALTLAADASSLTKDTSDTTVDLEWIVAHTPNYSGAELRGIVRNAAARAMYRRVDPCNPQNIVATGPVRVLMRDFVGAVEDVKPLFGIDDEIVRPDLPGAPRLLDYPSSRELRNKGLQYAEQLIQSEGSRLFSVLIHGDPGSGTSSLAIHWAREARTAFPYVKIVSVETMYRLAEAGKKAMVAQVFEDAYRSPASCIILSDVERLLEWCQLGPRFSLGILQCIVALVRKQPPPGHKLLVIGTSSNRRALEDLELYGIFDARVRVSSLMADDLLVLEGALAISIPTELPGQVGIKTLLLIARMLYSRRGGRSIRQDRDSELLEFFECFREVAL